MAQDLILGMKNDSPLILCIHSLFTYTLADFEPRSFVLQAEHCVTSSRASIEHIAKRKSRHPKLKNVVLEEAAALGVSGLPDFSWSKHSKLEKI
jgi:hypothetical protein